MDLFGLAARAAGMPLYAYLGGRRGRMVTDMTVGIMDTDAAVDRARRWAGVGFRALKIKVGRDWKADVKRVKAIRDGLGKAIELRSDGTQGYSGSDALSFARNSRNEGFAFFEQPASVDDGL